MGHGCSGHIVCISLGWSHRCHHEGTRVTIRTYVPRSVVKPRSNAPRELCPLPFTNKSVDREAKKTVEIIQGNGFETGKRCTFCCVRSVVIMLFFSWSEHASSMTWYLGGNMRWSIDSIFHLKTTPNWIFFLLGLLLMMD